VTEAAGDLRARPLDVRRLELLEHVDRAGTISAAADALNFTCSGLSHRLRQLESELGTALVSRGPRAATLTDAGRVLMAHGVFVREQLAHAEQEIRAIAGLQAGRLRMATFRSAGELVAAAVAYFSAHWPQVELTLREGEPEEYLPLVRRGEIDLALTFDHVTGAASADEPLAREPLRTEEIVVVLPAGHRLVGHERIPLAELAEEAWINASPRCAFATFTVAACRAAGFEPRVRIATDDFRIAGSLVGGGIGVTLMPRMAAAALTPRCVAREVAGDRLSRRIYAAHRPGGERAPAVARMLGVLRELSSDA
jgi:DNA-binding transcriptional LysR family regulator